MFKKTISQLRLSDYYAGIQAKIVQTVLYNAFLLIAYEKIRHAIKIIVLGLVRSKRAAKAV